MALQDSTYFSAIYVCTPANRELCEGFSRQYRNTDVVKARIGIAQAADPFTEVRKLAYYDKFKQDRDATEFNFWLGLVRGKADPAHPDAFTPDDFPEGTTQADIDAFYAAATVRFHRIQYEDDPESPLYRQLVNEAGDGPWNGVAHWEAELNSLGFVRLQQAPPPVDAWNVTRDQVSDNAHWLAGKAAAEAAGATLTNAQAVALRDATLASMLPDY